MWMATYGWFCSWLIFERGLGICSGSGDGSDVSVRLVERGLHESSNVLRTTRAPALLGVQITWHRGLQLIKQKVPSCRYSIPVHFYCVDHAFVWCNFAILPKHFQPCRRRTHRNRRNAAHNFHPFNPAGTTRRPLPILTSTGCCRAAITGRCVPDPTRGGGRCYFPFLQEPRQDLFEHSIQSVRGCRQPAGGYLR